MVGTKFDFFFSAEGRGFESKSVTDTRATTDKNDPFLNMGFKHGKKWVDKHGAKCNMGFVKIPCAGRCVASRLRKISLP